MRNIKELTLTDLEILFKSQNVPVYHARQVFSWIYQKNADSFTQMSNLPILLRKSLSKEFIIATLNPIKTLKSKDGTQKILFESKDHNFIESVLIPFDKRTTACISSQAGCKFACKFCASGMLGFKRNLTCAEILDEVAYLKKISKDSLTHIVFMGTGEPLDNYDNVLKAIRIINSPDAFNIGARRITISTCGIVPALEKLSREGLQVELSVSLHASDDKMRDEIMPINRKYPLKVLIDACRKYTNDTNRQITFEYILVKGLNSSLQNAIKLSKLLKGMNAKINLIPANPIQELGVFPPSQKDIYAFKDALVDSGVVVTLRKERGGDIDAACGQLRLRHQKGELK